MKKCPECGNPSYDGAPVCGNCGYKFPKSKSIVPKGEDIFKKEPKKEPKKEKPSDEESILEIVKEKPKNKGLTLLTVKNRINADPGETISFSDDGESILYDTIRTAIKNSGIGNITGIDISDPENIYLEYQSRYRLYLGNSEDIEYKLREAKKIIAEEDENDPNQIGEINLSILKKVYVEKLDTLEETTTAKKDVTTQPETTAPDSTDEPEEDETTTLPEEETEPDGEETTAEDIPEDE